MRERLFACVMIVLSNWAQGYAIQTWGNWVEDDPAPVAAEGRRLVSPENQVRRKIAEYKSKDGRLAYVRYVGNKARDETTDNIVEDHDQFDAEFLSQFTPDELVWIHSMAHNAPEMLTVDEEMEDGRYRLAMFTAGWCGGCRTQKARFKTAGISYSEKADDQPVVFGVDVDKNPQQWKNTGETYIPCFILQEWNENTQEWVEVDRRRRTIGPFKMSEFRGKYPELSQQKSEQDNLSDETE